MKKSDVLPTLSPDAKDRLLTILAGMIDTSAEIGKLLVQLDGVVGGTRDALEKTGDTLPDLGEDSLTESAAAIAAFTRNALDLLKAYGGERGEPGAWKPKRH